MNKTKLILLNGRAGVGKDTFVGLIQALNKDNFNLLNLHRSDRAKAAMKVLGWEDTSGKDGRVRAMLKDMVDYMEDVGILDRDLEEQIQICSTRDRDQVIFYHVRDPKVIQKLLTRYQDRDGLSVLSVLIQRETPAKEPVWWGNLETAEYDMTIGLPPDDMEKTKELAEIFAHYLNHM